MAHRIQVVIEISFDQPVNASDLEEVKESVRRHIGDGMLTEHDNRQVVDEYNLARSRVIRSCRPSDTDT